MLKTIQLIALLQGLFLLYILFSKRKTYKKPVLWLLFAAIVSVLFFIIGDDDNNLFVKDVDWFFFDTTLFITCLYLFVKYYVSNDAVFRRKDLLYFIPNILYFVIEISEATFPSYADFWLIEISELLLEVCFLVYLFLPVRKILQYKKQQWMLYGLIPLAGLLSFSIFNDIITWFGFNDIPLVTDATFATVHLIVVAFLFYFITMKLTLAPKSVLHFSTVSKYQSSGLNKDLLNTYKKKILSYMNDEKGYKNNALTLTVMSQDLNIPKQYISEILNIHMQTNFQDFVNLYRIEDFENYLQNDQYAHYSLMGIAEEVGFNSKSSFYATFKKIKGITPLEFKKSLTISV